jgi:hypothetical protein
MNSKVVSRGKLLSLKETQTLNTKAEIKITNQMMVLKKA